MLQVMVHNPGDPIGYWLFGKKKKKKAIPTPPPLQPSASEGQTVIQRRPPDIDFRLQRVICYMPLLLGCPRARHVFVVS